MDAVRLAALDRPPDRARQCGPGSTPWPGLCLPRPCRAGSRHARLVSVRRCPGAVPRGAVPRGAVSWGAVSWGDIRSACASPAITVMKRSRWQAPTAPGQPPPADPLGSLQFATSFGSRQIRQRARRRLRRCRITQVATQFAQECHSGRRALHQNATAIERIGLATNQIELRQAIKRPCDCGLGHVQLSRQPAHGLRFAVEIAGQDTPSCRADKSGPSRRTRSTIVLRRIPARPSPTSLALILRTSLGSLTFVNQSHGQLRHLPCACGSKVDSTSTRHNI